MEDSFTVVYASDAGYAIPTLVSMLSMLDRSSDPASLRLVLLADADFPRILIDAINQRLMDLGSSTLRVVEMGSRFADVSLHITHTTRATYYRLMLPSLLPDVDKCLYIDSDTVCVSDVIDLLNIDLHDNYIAGVKAAGYYRTSDDREKNRIRLGVPAFDQYVNAGVLLMNLERMRVDDIEDTFNQLMDRDFSSQDQDILNVACYGGVCTIEPKFNLMTKYPVLSFDDYLQDDALLFCYSSEEWRDAISQPVVIHYADRIKPWCYPSSQLASFWWDYYAKALDLVKSSCPMLISDFQTHNLLRLHSEIEEVTSRLKSTSSEMSKVRTHLEQTRAEKSAINARLQEAYAEKSAINARLQQTYREKTARGIEIRRLNEALVAKEDKHWTRSLFGRRSDGDSRKHAYEDPPKVVVFDAAIGSGDLGDEIIMHYSIEEIRRLFPDSHPLHVPTRRVPYPEEYENLRGAKYKFVCGVNLLCSDDESRDQWKLPESRDYYSDSILLSAGANQYDALSDSVFEPYIHLLSPFYLHSAQDELTSVQLSRMGVDNVVNTGCVAMWSLSAEMLQKIPTTKARQVVFTLSCNRKDGDADLHLIHILESNYERLFFFPQGNNDLDYLNELGISHKTAILPRRLTEYDELLSGGDVDYVGTRFHGGVHALNCGSRAFIIPTENSEMKIAKDANLPCFKRSELDRLNEAINCGYHFSLQINIENITKWRNQFGIGQ